MRGRYTIGLVVVGMLTALVTAQMAWANGDEEATPPMPLTGETLITSEAGEPGSSTLSGTCDPLGTSTFTFTVTGVAVGPYPGTFVEQGTFTLGPFAVVGVGFAPVSFDATFTITSSAGTVTGTKTLTQVPTPGFGACGAFVFAGTEPDAADLQVNTRYTAQIGGARDEGDSFVSYQDTKIRGVPGGNGFAFDESFTSTSFTPGEDGGDDDGQGENER